MKKIIITSSMMKKAHRKTKEMILQFPNINYRTQLGLEISNLLKLEKEYQLEVTLRVKAINWIKSIVNVNGTLDGQQLQTLSEKMNYDLNIRNFGFTQTYNTFDLAKEMVKRYSVKVAMYA